MNEKNKLALSIPLVTLGLLMFATPDSAKAQGVANVPICRGNQLLAYYEGWGLSMGNDYVKVIYRNRSAQSCRLHGFPRIHQFDEHGKDQGGIPGGCWEGLQEGPCKDDLVLNPSQRASFVLDMLDGTGMDNPICSNRLILDSPGGGTLTWPLLKIDGFVSCGAFGPYPLEYQTTPGVEIDPYIRMEDRFPRGAPSGGWSLDLIDAHAALGSSSRPYEPRYDPPFNLILENRNDGLLQAAVNSWCDGGVVIELRIPGGKLMRRTAPPCKAPESRAPELDASARARGALPLTLQLYDLGYDLSRMGEYKLRVRWRLPGAAPVLVESNEIAFTVGNSPVHGYVYTF